MHSRRTKKGLALLLGAILTCGCQQEETGTIGPDKPPDPNAPLDPAGSGKTKGKGAEPITRATRK